MITFTPEQFVQTVRDVIRDRGPEFRYTPPGDEETAECSYQHEGAPSCLFGEVLERLGVPYDPEWEGTGIASVIAILDGLAPLDQVAPEWETVVFAARGAQLAQDSGKDYEYVGKQFEHSLARP